MECTSRQSLPKIDIHEQTMQKWCGTLVIVFSPPQGYAFKVCEEHVIMIDENPESDTLLNITLFLKCAGLCGISVVPFYHL